MQSLCVDLNLFEYLMLYSTKLPFSISPLGFNRHQQTHSLPPVSAVFYVDIINSINFYRNNRIHIHKQLPCICQSFAYVLSIFSCSFGAYNHEKIEIVLSFLVHTHTRANDKSFGMLTSPDIEVVVECMLLFTF